MGGLNLVVTGAAGFLGRHVCEVARARGHSVTPVVRRPVADLPDALQCDVSELGPGDLAGSDAVIHLAASMRGDAETQRRDTVDATRALIAAMRGTSPMPRLVLVSSVSVYAHDAVEEGGILDERSALETQPELRDRYCQNKLLQEELARQSGLPLTILRPGAIYGPGQTGNAHIGPRVGPVLVRFSRRGELPLVAVQNAALAIVLACEAPPAGPVNLIDPDAPDRETFLAAVGAPRLRVHLPWRLMAGIGRLLAFWKGRPGLLHPGIVQARMMPVRYDTTAMRELVEGAELVPFSTAMAGAREGSE